MAIKKQYAKSQETAIASYNYIDIAEGTGTTIFLPCDASGSNTLSANAYYALNGYTQTTTGAKTVSFDAVFNAPQTVKGRAIISVPMATDNQTGNTQNGWVLETVHYINKIDTDSVETIIASGSNRLTFNMNIGGQDYKQATLALTLPRTHFKKGETLRYKMVLPPSLAIIPLYAGHDAKGRSSGVPSNLTWANTAMAEVHIPFDLDL